MNIFGIGEWELLLIVVLMLVVAGPQRMIRWSYWLGKQIAKFRPIWYQVRQTIDKEMQALQVEELRQSINQGFTKPLTSAVREYKDVMSEVSKQTDLNPVKPSAAPAPTATPAPPAAPADAAPTNGAFGAWSGHAASHDEQAKGGA